MLKMNLYFISKNTRLTSLSLWGGALFSAVLFWAASPSEAIVSTAHLHTYSIPYETIGTPTGTTVQFTITVGGDIEIDIYRLENITDPPSAANQVAAIQQQGLAPGTYQVPWDALWLIGGDIGRHNGNFRVIVRLGTTSSFVIPTLLSITSVDIHGVNVTPSLDANNNAAFPFTINYSLAKDALVTVQIRNSSNAIVRTLRSNVAQSNESLVPTNTVSWNGLDDNNRPVALGIYTVVLNARDANSTDVAITRTRTVAVSSLANLESDLKQLFETNVYVYPNPVRNGQATFSALAVRNNATIHLKIYTLTGDLVRDESFPNLSTASAATFVWDGTNEGGKKVGRGLYYFVVRQEDPEGTLQTVEKVAVIP
jgi:flagellar hook assembly protein FlgD